MGTDASHKKHVLFENIGHLPAQADLINETLSGPIRILERWSKKYSYLLYLASFNAFLGNKEKAYEYLRIINQRTRMPIWMIKDIKNDPLFDSLRDDQEFQQIVMDVVAKYKAEDERVRIWLEKEGML